MNHSDRIFTPGFVYAICLFLLAGGTLWAVAASGGGWLPADRSPWWLLFFLLYGLFTIHTGCMHPRVGHVSFDRVAQVASILVLGPVPAAWINGLASLIWPLQRLREGRPLRDVVSASLHNSGLMTLMIVACGQAYLLLGGPVPLTTLDGRSALLLVVLILAMQLVNEVLMIVHQRLRDPASGWEFYGFAVAIEIGAALAGVMVALVINRMELPIVALVLVVLGIAMVALNQFALMRNRLESLVQERTEVLQDKMREFEELAAQDQLTGLVNRRSADEALFRCIGDFTLEKRQFSIALIDLDHFKSINDQHSHETGDQVLKKVAQLLASGCRDQDVLARYGGEEFLICFPDIGADEAGGICESMRQAVESTDWSEVLPDFQVTLSAGVAGMQSGLTRSLLLKAADARLYKAKRAGRNRVVTD